MPTILHTNRSTLLAYAAIGVVGMPIAQIGGERIAALFCIVAVLAVSLSRARR